MAPRIKRYRAESGQAEKKQRKRRSPLRSSSRLIAKAIMQKRRVGKRQTKVNFCTTRTVELASAQTVGDEKHKLLFMLALNLIPKYGKFFQLGIIYLINKKVRFLKSELHLQRRKFSPVWLSR